MPLAVGSQAPDFTLKTKTADGLKDIKLSDNFGKKQTVLLFFPLAYTGVCTQELCDISSGLSAYAGLGAEVYGISVDSPFAHEAGPRSTRLASRCSPTSTRPSPRPMTWCSPTSPGSATPRPARRS
jgi:peroxiredoxin